jgi:magnesium chelatase subunit D
MRPYSNLPPNQILRQAVMLLAVDPCLKGLLIASNGSSAEVEAVKFYKAIIPDDSCRAVKVPLNITEDRLLGSIDIERTISTGQRQTSLGSLAEADGGVMLVSHINLLDASIVNHIAAAIDSRVVQLEREGISEIHSARFVLIGAVDKSEGGLNMPLGDRVGLAIEFEEHASTDDRTDMLARELLDDNRRDVQPFENLDEMTEIKAAINRARKNLSRVKVSRKNLRNLIEAGMSLGVEGNRADIFALCAARASAAIGDRRAIAEEDLINAIRFVLMPRANKFPDIEESRSSYTSRENHAKNSQNSEADDRSAGDTTNNIEDMIVKATDATLPENALGIIRHKSRGFGSGKRIDSHGSTRGRYAQSIRKRPREARIAIDATLRAAAPFQSVRRRANAQNHSAFADKKLRIVPDDLRYKKFKRKAGVLFIFCVDASGSMAANRMAQAKGALTRLLQDAYLHRDKVALISFRGEEAEVLLEPTRSVELGKRLVDAMPAGGGTPLAKGLLRAIEMARLSRSKEKSNAMLVLFTDGRANVALRADDNRERDKRSSTIQDELKEIGAAIQREDIYSVVIDTRSKFLSGGEGLSLADWLGGRYIYLPRANADTIYNSVASTATDARTRSRS